MVISEELGQLHDAISWRDSVVCDVNEPLTMAEGNVLNFPNNTTSLVTKLVG